MTFPPAKKNERILISCACLLKILTKKNKKNISKKYFSPPYLYSLGSTHPSLMARWDREIWKKRKRNEGESSEDTSVDWTWM